MVCPVADPPELITDISVAVYKVRLNQEHKTNVARMLAKDADGGTKLRGRAAAYDPLTRAYLKVLREMGLLK